MSSCFEKPPAAPCTALASSARSRPWRERSGPLSPGRVTLTTPSCTSTGKPGKSDCSTRPFGPSATNTPSRTSTLVPCGMGMGILPIRDIASLLLLLLPDLAEELAADPALARLGVGQQPLRRRDDPDAEAVAHRLDLVRLAVDPPARLAHPLQVRDGRYAFGAVAQEDAQRALRLRRDLPEILDEALVLEELRDLHFQLGHRDVEPVVLGDLRVADAGQQVRDRVGHAHTLGLLAYQLALMTPGR